MKRNVSKLPHRPMTKELKIETHDQVWNDLKQERIADYYKMCEGMEPVIAAKGDNDLHG